MSPDPSTANGGVSLIFKDAFNVFGLSWLNFKFLQVQSKSKININLFAYASLSRWVVFKCPVLSHDISPYMSVYQSFYHTIVTDLLPDWIKNTQYLIY